MNYVNISNHTRVAGRQVNIVHYAGGKMQYRERDMELGNFARSTRRAYARNLEDGMTM